MLIDWFTVCAQIVNLLILVWLMKRFLYKPILAAIAAREKLIAAELADAAQKKTEAQKEHDEFDQKNATFDKERAALLDKAKTEADAERQKLLDEASKAADALSAKRMEALRNDELSLNSSIAQKASQQVFTITRSVLKDLATASLEERMGEVFDRRLRELDGKTKDILSKALKASVDPAIVRSTFDMPVEQRAAIQNALNETFQMDVKVQFATAPDSISGIELSKNGQTVGWTISDYLSSLENGVNELLKKKPLLDTDSNSKGKDNEHNG